MSRSTALARISRPPRSWSSSTESHRTRIPHPFSTSPTRKSRAPASWTPTHKALLWKWTTRTSRIPFLSRVAHFSSFWASLALPCSRGARTAKSKYRFEVIQGPARLGGAFCFFLAAHVGVASHEESERLGRPLLCVGDAHPWSDLDPRVLYAAASHEEDLLAGH